MTRIQRRRATRYSTDLPVQYRFRADAAWRNCRIIDVSEHGAAVELHEVGPGESFGQRIDLEISSLPTDATGAVLRGQIRRRTLRPDSSLVVGVEFTPSSSECAGLLRLLIGLHSLATDA
jgi:hypothetical protein